MSSVVEAGMAGGEEDSSSARSDEPEARSEVRWSAPQGGGRDAVAARRVLDLLARKTNQPAGRIATWRWLLPVPGGPSRITLSLAWRKSSWPRCWTSVFLTER